MVSSANHALFSFSFSSPQNDLSYLPEAVLPVHRRSDLLRLTRLCPWILPHGLRPSHCQVLVWFEHAVRPEHYPLRRCKVNPYTSHNGWEQEHASYKGWYIDSGTAVDPAAQHQDY